MDRCRRHRGRVNARIRSPVYIAAMLSARIVRRAAWLVLTIGASAARLIAAPDGTAMPRATTSRACAYQNTSVARASQTELRSAVVCLIDLARRRWGLPWLGEQGELDNAAQAHADQMVANRVFSHTGAGDSTPGLRLNAVGFRWAAWGEAISTGYATPMRAVAAWLASTGHCQILLSPNYSELGVGVTRSPVAGYTRRPGTWTADFALPAGRGSPSGNWGPAEGCPY